MPIRVRECLDCAEVFEVFCRDGLGQFINMDHDRPGADPEPTCGCGSTNLKAKVTKANVIFTGDEAGYSRIYPYFDNSLNMRIHSKAHHDRVMREQNLHHVTPEDVAAGARHLSEEQRKIEEAERADREALQRNKEMLSEVRRQVDRGMHTDHLAPEIREAAKKQIHQSLEA